MGAGGGGGETGEQMVSMRDMMEKCGDRGHPLCLCFIDYSQAFDCVYHSQMWNTVAKMGFPGHIIELIQNLYHDQGATVGASGGNTGWFEVGGGGGGASGLYAVS